MSNRIYHDKNAIFHIVGSDSWLLFTMHEAWEYVFCIESDYVIYYRGSGEFVDCSIITIYNTKTCTFSCACFH